MSESTTDSWDKPLAGSTPGDLYWPVVWGLQKHPVFSMFSEKAIQGFAQAMVDCIPTKEDS